VYIRAREAAVSAVSEPEKKAEKTKRTAMAAIVSRICVSISDGLGRDTATAVSLRKLLSSAGL